MLCTRRSVCQSLTHDRMADAPFLLSLRIDRTGLLGCLRTWLDISQGWDLKEMMSGTGLAVHSCDQVGFFL